MKKFFFNSILSLKNLKKYLPYFILSILQKMVIIKRVLFNNPHNFYCIFCKKEKKGYYVGLFPHFYLACSKCFSLGRHRHQAKFIESIDLSGKKILHFAAEEPLKNFLNKKNIQSYIKVDISPKSDEVFCDIENIHFEQNSFDIIICNHVLEHVNFKKALNQLNKVLRTNGLLLLSFPIIYQWEKTYTNQSIESQKLREIHFGQFDHISLFGKDIENTIEQFNFKLSKNISFGEQSVKNGIDHGEILYIATKQ